MQNGENNEIVESLFQAIETITKKQMSGLTFDKTILCKVTDDKYRNKGEYVVSDGTSTFIAFSENTTFLNGTSVYVTIPGSDFNNKKLIIGKYTDSDNDKYHTYQEPFDDLLDVTGNIINEVNRNSLSILANGGAELRKREKVIWEKAWRDPTSLMKKAYSRLGLRAKFLTKFAGLDVAAGTYGLRLDIVSREETTSKTENTEKYYSCDFGVLDFYGDPYKFEGAAFQQEKVFDISEITQIIAMQLVLYQNNDFLNYKKEVVTHTMGPDGNLPDNIEVSDVYLSLGFSMDEFTGDEILLYTYDPKTFVATNAEKDLLRTIEGRWVHFENEGDTVPILIDRIDEIPGYNKSGTDYTKIHWYKFSRTESEKDELAGNFWKEIRPLKDSAATLKNLSDEAMAKLESKYTYKLNLTIPDNEEDIRLITAVKEELSDKDGNTFSEHYNSLSQPVKLDKTMSEERYKVIIECPSRLYCIKQMINEMALLSQEDFKTADNDGLEAYKIALRNIEYEWNSRVKLYYSDDFVFQNEEEVPNSATIDAIRGLKIICDPEGLKGNYCIYNTTNEIMNPTESKKVRTMKATYESLVTGESSLDKAESITWKIPIVNTMIYKPELDVEYKTTDTVKYFGYDANGNEVIVDRETDIPSPTHILITRKGTEIYDVGENLEAIQIEAQQNFRIKDYYVGTATNNTVYCTVVKNKFNVQAETELVFGPQGSNGTDTTLLLKWADNKGAITPGATQKVKAYLYDYENKEVEISDMNGMKWEWWSNGDSISKGNLSITNQDARSCTIKASSTGNFRGWVLKGTLHHGAVIDVIEGQDQDTTTVTRNIYLEAYLPIAVCSSGVSFAEIGDRVIYDSSGANPFYYKNPLRVFATDGTLLSNDVNDWFVAYDENGEAEKFYPSIRKKDNDALLYPKGMYYADTARAVTVCWSNGRQFWNQSLYIGQNRFPSAMLNAWDGSLTIDEKNGTILSTMIGAGKKNTDNSFSGVLMGDIKTGANIETGNHSGLGIYGFNFGEQSFGFNIEGTAFIGKSGRGRIVFNGNQGTITSGNYEKDKTGMMIDLDGTDGKSSSLFAYGGGGRFLLDTATEAKYLLKVADGENKDLIVISTDSVQTEDGLGTKSKYYLQSSNFSASSKTGTKLDLQNGKLVSYGLSGKFILDTSSSGTTNTILQIKDGSDKDLFVVSTKTTTDGDTTSNASSKYYLQSSTFDSTNKKGTRFDLQNGKITTYGEKGYVIIDSSNSNYLMRISGKVGDTYKDLLTVGSTYKLQSLDYDATTEKGLYFNLSTGSLTAYTFKLSAGTGENKIIINSSQSSNPLKIGPNFSVSWDGTATLKNIVATAGGTIGPFKITSTALTGSGITLGGSSIKAGTGFSVDAAGNVSLSGRITGVKWNVTSGGTATFTDINAKGGYIAGWKISESSISNGSVSMNSSGIQGSGGSKFNLDSSSGKITASDAVFTNFTVKNSAKFTDACAITVDGKLTVTGAAGSKTLIISGDTQLGGKVNITGQISTNGRAVVGYDGDIVIEVDTPWSLKTGRLTFRNGLLIAYQNITAEESGAIPELEKTFVTIKDFEKFKEKELGDLAWVDDIKKKFNLTATGTVSVYEQTGTKRYISGASIDYSYDSEGNISGASIDYDYVTVPTYSRVSKTVKITGSQTITLEPNTGILTPSIDVSYSGRTSLS